MTDDDQLDIEGLGPKALPQKRKPPQRRRKGATGDAEPDAAVVAPDGASSDSIAAEAAPAPSLLAPPPETGPTIPGDAGAPKGDEPRGDGAAVAAVAPAPDGSSDGSVPLYFLTNRMNLNGVLSSRIIAPRGSFQKYYSDLLEDAPGWVPLLTRPPSKALLERVATERGAGGPVILELSLPRAGAGQPHPDVVFVPAALLSDVKAIHFPDQRSLREHRARAYGNVHAHEDLLRVTPAMFASDLRFEAEFVVPSEGALEVDWQRLDRVRGAFNGLLAASDSGEALAITAAALGASGVPEGVPAPPWLRWAVLTEDPIDAGHESTEQTADRLIFCAAYEVLGQRDQTVAWSPAEVLDAVTSRIAATRPDDAVMGVINRNLRRVRELVNAERDFEPFRNPGSPYVAAKSLLLVLLRPDLEQLLAWSPEDTGADEATLLVTAVLAGRLRGLARESATVRSPELDDLTAAWAVRAGEGVAARRDRAQYLSDDTRTVLLINGCEIRSASALTPHPGERYEKVGREKRASVRVEVSRRLGWPVETRIHLPAKRVVTIGESAIVIESSEAPAFDTFVDEPDFLMRLGALTGRARGDAVRAINESDKL